MTSAESFGGRPTLAAGVGVTQAASAKLQCRGLDRRGESPAA